ncbi:MAG: SWIB/MDM2 domain protein, partial [Harvfovirus sp.]
FNCPNALSMHTLITTNCVEIIESILLNGYDIGKNTFMAAINCQNVTIAELFSKYDKTDINISHLNAAAEKNKPSVVINILQRKIQPTSVTVDHAFTNKNANLVKTLIEMGAVPLNEKLLVKACDAQNYELIKMFLDLKILPTKECFKSLVSADFAKYGRRSYYYRKTAKNDMDNTNSLVDLLVSYGFKPDYDDIVIATNNHLKLNNIEMFEIKLDDKFLELCAELNFYPYKLTDVKPNVKCLELACKKAGNLVAIKTLVKSGLKPDLACLQAACQMRSNLATIRFIIDQGVVPDFICIRHCAATLGNKTLSFLLSLYKSDEEQEVAVDDESSESIEDDTSGSPPALELPEDLPEVVIADEISEEEIPEEVIPEEPEEPEESPKKKTKGKIIVKGKAPKNEVVIEEAPLLPQTIVKITKPTKEIKLKELYSLNDKLSLLLTNEEGNKMTFLDAKQKLLEYVNKNDLFDKTDKFLIKIDAEINKISGFEVNKYLNFMDFDNFVANCLLKN